MNLLQNIMSPLPTSQGLSGAAAQVASGSASVGLSSSDLQQTVINNFPRVGTITPTCVNATVNGDGQKQRWQNDAAGFRQLTQSSDVSSYSSQFCGAYLEPGAYETDDGGGGNDAGPFQANLTTIGILSASDIVQSKFSAPSFDADYFTYPTSYAINTQYAAATNAKF